MQRRIGPGTRFFRRRAFLLAFGEGLGGGFAQLRMIGVSGLLAFAVFSLCFVSLVHRKLRYIQKLKKELDILAGGDLT